MAKRKRTRKQSKLTSMTKEYVGAGVGLGVGSTVLGGMGQGAIAGKIITPAANMMGPVVSAGYGMQVLDTLNKKSKKENKHK